MAYIGKVKVGSTTYNVGSTLYLTCSTAANTAAKTVTASGFTLESGVTVYVKFSNTNSASSPTLNINSTGAKPIIRYGTTAVGDTEDTSWSAGAVVSLTYDGTNWVMSGSASSSSAGVRIIKLYNISSLPAGIADASIDSKYVLLNIGLSNPSAQTSDWTITTSDYVNSSTNNIVVAGSISGSTDITLYLAQGKDEIHTSSGTVNLDLATIDPSVITTYENLGWTQPTT